jgi:hypothetical protein
MENPIITSYPGVSSYLSKNQVTYVYFIMCEITGNIIYEHSFHIVVYSCIIMNLLK